MVKPRSVRDHLLLIHDSHAWLQCAALSPLLRLGFNCSSSHKQKLKTLLSTTPPPFPSTSPPPPPLSLTVHDEGHEHQHRDFASISRLLSHSLLPPPALALCQRAFLFLAQAEAAVHGVAVEEVHFHEVRGERGGQTHGEERNAIKKRRGLDFLE